MTTIFLSFVKQKSLLKSRLTRSQKAQNWITIYVGMRPTSGIHKIRALLCIATQIGIRERDFDSFFGFVWDAEILGIE